MDFNLVGMGYLHCSRVLFRDPLPRTAGASGAHTSGQAEPGATPPLSSGSAGGLLPLQYEQQPALELSGGGLLGSGSQRRQWQWTQRSVPVHWQWSAASVGAR